MRLADTLGDCHTGAANLPNMTKRTAIFASGRKQRLGVKTLTSVERYVP